MATHDKVPILVVDDDADIRSVLRCALEDEGYVVTEETNGRAALVRLRTERRRLVVVLDWWMPGMDGVSLLRAAAADPRIARRHGYVLMTASADALPAGLLDAPGGLPLIVLHKPFDLMTLLAAVDRVRDSLYYAA